MARPVPLRWRRREARVPGERAELGGRVARIREARAARLARAAGLGRAARRGRANRVDRAETKRRAAPGRVRAGKGARIPAPTRKAGRRVKAVTCRLRV